MKPVSATTILEFRNRFMEILVEHKAPLVEELLIAYNMILEEVVNGNIIAVIYTDNEIDFYSLRHLSNGKFASVPL